MWEGDLERARIAFETVCARLSAYAAAQGHLAMVEAALARRERAIAVFHRWMQEEDLAQAREESHVTHTSQAAVVERYERAIALLRQQANSSDDPEYASQLARLLKEVGQLDEAQHWRDIAAARYDELMVRHPEAFADHAAEFWLTVGGDAQRGHLLAAQNFELRKTSRAYELILQAAVATQETATVCRVAEHLGTFENKTSPLLWYPPGISFLEESPWNSRTRSRRCSSRQQNRSRAVPDGCLWPAPSKSWGLGDNGVRNVNSGGAG